mgnify:FL=1
MNKNVISTEFLKLKRTLLVYLCVGSPLIISCIIFLYFFVDDGTVMAQVVGSRWLFFAELLQTYWGIFFLPLFVTLQTALLAGIEHNGKMWKLLYVQPVKKLDILSAKILAALIVFGVSQALLLPMTLAGGMLLRRFNPALGFESVTPVSQIILLDLSVYGLSLIIISLHAWVSLKWESFVTAVTFGIIATVSGVIVMNSRIASYYPWAMPGLIANHFFELDFPWANLGYSLGLSTIILLAGLLDLIKKETY